MPMWWRCAWCCGVVELSDPGGISCWSLGSVQRVCRQACGYAAGFGLEECAVGAEWGSRSASAGGGDVGGWVLLSCGAWWWGSGHGAGGVTLQGGAGWCWVELQGGAAGEAWWAGCVSAGVLSVWPPL